MALLPPVRRAQDGRRPRTGKREPGAAQELYANISQYPVSTPEHRGPSTTNRPTHTMAETDPADDLPATHEQPPEDRYATLDLAHGETVIYDRENPRAWLQSDGAVSMAGMS